MILSETFIKLWRREKGAPEPEFDDAALIGWREKIATVTKLTANADADGKEVTTALIDVYREGRRIERSLGDFPNQLAAEKDEVKAVVVKLWRQCKDEMVSLLLSQNLQSAQVIKTRLRTMCRLGELLGFQEQLPGYEIYNGSKGELTQEEVVRIVQNGNKRIGA